MPVDVHPFRDVDFDFLPPIMRQQRINVMRPSLEVNKLSQLRRQCAHHVEERRVLVALLRKTEKQVGVPHSTDIFGLDDNDSSSDDKQRPSLRIDTSDQQLSTPSNNERLSNKVS
jgi:hypothetical protein